MGSPFPMFSGLSLYIRRYRFFSGDLALQRGFTVTDQGRLKMAVEIRIPVAVNVTYCAPLNKSRKTVLDILC